MGKLIIIGAGGHGKVCGEIARDMNKWDEICFLDESYPHKKECLEFKIIGSTNNILDNLDAEYFVAIGNNKTRKKYLSLLEKKKYKIATLIHPSSYISRYSKIGVGTSVHQFSVVNSSSVIGKGCIINTSSIVEHDCKISDYTHLSPQVKMGGNVFIGNECWIGIGATIINNVKISSNVIIGAGSLVVRNVYLSGVYKGLVK